MNGTKLELNRPELPILLELGPVMAAALESAQVKEEIARAVSDSFADLLTTLGVPATPLVQLTAADGNLPQGRPLSLFVNGRQCRYPPDVLLHARRYVADESTIPTGEKVWLSDLTAMASKGVEVGRRQLAEFLALATAEIAKKKPSVLLGTLQIAAYRKALVDAEGGPHSAPDEKSLQSTLDQLLDLRISIGDIATIAELVTTNLAMKPGDADLVESLIATLRPQTVEILIPVEYLQQITTRRLEGERDRFAGLRNDLFSELGVTYPPFKFVPVTDLKAGSFAFRINHLRTMPTIGTAANETLADDGDKKEPLLYLAERLGDELRVTTNCFIDITTVEGFVESLGEAFPAKVRAASAKFSIAQLTRMLRALTKEELSIRNLGLILELALDYDYIVCDSSEYIVFDDRLPTSATPDERWVEDPANLTSFIRSGLKRYITNKYTRGQATLTVLLLSGAVEAAVMEWAASRDEETGERILQALQSELDMSGATVNPAILTLIEVRPVMRDLIALDHPRLPVISYQELAPDVNIVPLARVEIEDAGMR